MGRQVGSALGIAILVAVLGTGTVALSGFHSAWLISALGGLSAGVAIAALGPAVRTPAAAPMVAEAAAS
jgi:hypothetical protein